MPDALPTYHLTSPTGEDCYPFDPNGAIYWKGRYHLGFIIGWFEECTKHFWWGHVSSADLVDWKVHPPMLSPCPGEPEQGIFSGNAFVDKQGRAVIHYHGVGAGNCVAIDDGDEELNSFVKHPANPVMTDPGWDPFGWLEGDVYYSISGSEPTVPGAAAALYRCSDDDQAEWTLVGPLLSHDLPEVEPDEDISCPELFQLGDKRVLLCISHTRGARYYLGRFEGERFHPERHFRMNWPGGACFAPETLLDERGRRIFWAWAYGSPSTMTLPRVLSMREDGLMGIEPAEELDSLRRNHRRLEPATVEPGAELDLEGVRGDCMELRVTIDPGQATRCGLKVRCSPEGLEETAIAYDAERKLLNIELAKSSQDKKVLPALFVLPEGERPVTSAQEAPFELEPGEALELRIYLDKSILEVFANGRQCLTQRIYPTREDSLGVRLFSTGGAAGFTSIDAWDMAPIVIRRK
ncbi:MAG TPA: glycoside hydrolase family 32 protein [Solirubrobacterales bacterium]|nr:glycoside hydrolase family 32 protein [Solirubrobacterales bacterium]